MHTTLVTGANRGIGLSLCQLLRARGHNVIAVCRNKSPELERIGAKIEAGVDVTDDASLARLRERLTGTSIDWLIANAGVLRSDVLGKLDFAQLREQFEVNALGPLRTVEHLRGLLPSGAKLALITSRMGSIADNGSGGEYGYRMSKAALNAAGMSLTRDLARQGVAVAMLHPGYVRTDMTGGHGQLEPSESARMLIERIDALSPKTSGTFWHANGEVLPW